MWSNPSRFLHTRHFLYAYVSNRVLHFLRIILFYMCYLRRSQTDFYSDMTVATGNHKQLQLFTIIKRSWYCLLPHLIKVTSLVANFLGESCTSSPLPAASLGKPSSGFGQTDIWCKLQRCLGQRTVPPLQPATPKNEACLPAKYEIRD